MLLANKTLLKFYILTSKSITFVPQSDDCTFGYEVYQAAAPYADDMQCFQSSHVQVNNAVRMCAQQAILWVNILG